MSGERFVSVVQESRVTVHLANSSSIWSGRCKPLYVSVPLHWSWFLSGLIQQFSEVLIYLRHVALLEAEET
jgi:hypothetical protein